MVDGVPAYTADIRTAFTGTLMFGVGVRDESARTAGTAHLVEHLVMNRVGKVAITHNATTSEESLSFFAQGPPELVADFLSRVSRAIATFHEITDEDVAEQRRIIAAELGADDELPGRGPLLTRFGAKNLGLLDLGTPAHRSLTRSDALEFANSWLHTGNAALAFTGDIPEPLSLHLPMAGPVPERSVPALLPQRHTGWVVDGNIPLTISILLGPASPPVMAITGSIIAEALHSELRTSEQLIYSVTPFFAATASDRRFVAYALDPRPENAVTAAASALRVLRDVAEHGPSEHQFRDEIDRWLLAAEDPQEQAAALDNAVTAMLRGRREPADLKHPDVTSVRPEDVKAALSAALPSVFITFAEGSVSGLESELSAQLALPPSLDTEAVYSGMSKRQLVMHLARPGVELFSPKPFRGLRGWTLTLDADRLTISAPGQRPVDMAFADVTLASYSERERLWNLVSLDGVGLAVYVDSWRSARRLHSAMESRIPAEARFAIQ
jgi:hypothetical protein